MIRIAGLIVLVLWLAGPLAAVRADPDLDVERRLEEIEEQLDSHNRDLERLKDGGGGCVLLFLFGFVLSMWAMNRNRDGCWWFILGCIPLVNIVAGLVALNRELESRRARGQDI